MKYKKGTLLCAVLGLVLASNPAAAHHGTGVAYDLTKTIVLKVTLTELAWQNPHVQIYFDAKGENGNVTHWGCESFGPGRLAKLGWSRDSIKPGEQITVYLHPSKSGAPYGDLIKVVLANGDELNAQPY